MTQRESNQENSLPTSNDQTLSERLRDCVKVTFSAGLHGVESDCRQAAEELDRQRAEIERLQSRLGKIYWATTTNPDGLGLGDIQNICRPFSETHDPYADQNRALVAEIAARRGITLGHLREDGGCELAQIMRRLDAADAEVERLRQYEPLTDAQCDDVIAFLEDYEWTGLTRENVRTWCTAIACARFEVERLTGELDEARKPPHCPTCGGGR